MIKNFFKVLFALLFFTGTAAVAAPVVYDTVPTGVPQYFGGPYYKFAKYLLADSMLMIAPGDTNAIPAYPAFKFKSSNNRWYAHDRSRWQSILIPSDTAGKWTSQAARLVDTMYRVNDSTIGYTIKNQPYSIEINGHPGWSLTGNAGTTAGNFIGTTDNVAFNIRTNNTVKYSISSSAMPITQGGNGLMIFNSGTGAAGGIAFYSASPAQGRIRWGNTGFLETTGTLINSDEALTLLGGNHNLTSGESSAVLVAGQTVSSTGNAIFNTMTIDARASPGSGSGTARALNITRSLPGGIGRYIAFQTDGGEFIHNGSVSIRSSAPTQRTLFVGGSIGLLDDSTQYLTELTTHKVLVYDSITGRVGAVLPANLGPAKKYTVLLSQSGTSNPVATILENNIGTIVWTRSFNGEYSGTLTGAFPSGKVWAVAGNSDGLLLAYARLYRANNDTVILNTYDSIGALIDDFSNISIEIRVYP